MRLRQRNKKLLAGLLAVGFWLAVWQIASVVVGQEMLLVSPVRACETLISLMGTGDFYARVASSFGRILTGFALGLLLGTLLAGLSKAWRFVRTLLAPLMYTVKATPVASFVILALIWISSKNLSVFIAFLMVLPIVYTNVLAGLDSADTKLLEMAKVFRLRRRDVLRAIYLPATYPHILAAAKLSLGMCWKAGIAAEVISQPRKSIGSALQLAKLYFDTPQLFAWTLAIILLSIVFERLVLLLIGWLMRRAEGGAEHDPS